MATPPNTLAVLVSGSGTTLQNLIDQTLARRLDARVKLVIGSKPGLGALQRAARAELPHVLVDRKSFPDVETFSREIFTRCDEARVDLVCLAGPILRPSPHC